MYASYVANRVTNSVRQQYLNEQLYNLSAEINRNLPSGTDVTQIAPTSHLEVKFPTAIKLPIPEILLAF